MARAYDYDLRVKVIEAVKSGHQVVDVSKIFNIGRATVQRWLKKFREEGDMSPKVNWQKGHSHKIKDLDEFRESVAAKPQRTVAEIASDLGGVGKSTVYRALQKIDFTRKKNKPLLQRTQGREARSLYRAH